MISFILGEMIRKEQIFDRQIVEMQNVVFV